MKKAPLSPRHQARRRRALERFKIRDAARGEDPKTYAAYVERKQRELAALQARLA